jgi:D-amino peptidase
VRNVVVKESLSREAALSVHPEVARERIRRGAAAAVADAGSLAPPRLTGTLEVDLLTADMAAQAAWVRGVERAGERTVAIATDDPLSAYRAFVAVVAITRGLATA